MLTYAQRLRRAKERRQRRDPNAKMRNRTFEAVTIDGRVRVQFAVGGPEKNCFKIAGADYYIGMVSHLEGRPRKWSEFSWGNVPAARVKHISEIFPDLG